MTANAALETSPALSDLVSRVEAGEEVAITRGGATVARLVPASSANPADAKRGIERTKALRRGVRLGDLSVEELIDDGRM